MTRLVATRAGSTAAMMLFLAVSAGTAHADESAADVAAARSLGTEGVQLAEQGKCTEAIEKLDRAEKLHHAPTTAGRLGECHIEVGHVVLGTEILQRLVREQLPPGSPPAFTSAIERARKVLPSALPRIAKLHVVVAAPAGTKFRVSVDGQPLSDAAIDVDRPTDPGPHTVEASAPGFLTASHKVTLKDAESQRVNLTLEPDPNAPKNPPPLDPAPFGAAGSESSSTAQNGTTATPAPDASEPPRSRAAAFTALAIGGVGVVVGTVTGVMALGKASSLSEACQAKVCPSDKQSEIDSAKTLGTISTVGFVVGGVGLATGVVLLLTGGSKASTSATAHARVEPVVGDRFWGMRGSF